MREITLNGYIDEEEWYGDEITPEGLKRLLTGEKGDMTDDVHMTINSYGGSCNAATQMHDMIAGYPGKVHVTISGTAASAATFMVMAADEVNMTPGSMFMIHDPSMVAWGNERDMEEAIQTLKAHKEAIINCYEERCALKREEISALMSATTWMHAKDALEKGFIDGIKGRDAADCANERERAELGVRAWFDRKTRPARNQTAGKNGSSTVTFGDSALCMGEPNARDEPGEPMVKASDLMERLMKLK